MAGPPAVAPNRLVRKSPKQPPAGAAAEAGDLIGRAPARLNLGRRRLEPLIVVEVLECGSVERVAARLADRAHLRAAGASELRVVVGGEHFELPDTLDAHRRAVIVVLGIDVRDAVELVIGRSRGRAVRHHVAAAGSEERPAEPAARRRHARRLGRDAVDVAAGGVRRGDRHLFQRRFVVGPLQLGPRDLNRRGRRLHGDGFRYRCHGEIEVDDHAVVHADDDPLTGLAPEAAELGADVVGARRQVRHPIQSVARRRGDEGGRGPGVDGRDGHAREHTTLRVFDAPLYRAGDHLRTERPGAAAPHHEHDTKHGQPSHDSSWGHEPVTVDRSERGCQSAAVQSEGEGLFSN